LNNWYGYLYCGWSIFLQHAETLYMLFSHPCAPRHTLTAVATALLSLVALPAAATNGMNLDAYGAKAGAMGGASFAYENGNSALMNNPATLGLRKEGSNLGLGLTLLQPNVNTSMNHPMAGPMTAKSGGDAYWMPSVSFIRKAGKLTYGVAARVKVVVA
jgi:long-chain fatty acid transport protein